jgi:hypothetical protein
MTLSVLGGASNSKPAHAMHGVTEVARVQKLVRVAAVGVNVLPPPSLLL